MRIWSLNSLNFVLGISIHDYWPAPVPLPPKGALAGHIEGAVPLGYSYLLRKISHNVLFDGWGAVQQGHDVGFLIPHYNIIPPAPPNLMLFVIIPFSSAKANFGKAAILVNGKPAAAHFPALENMLLCGNPVKLPTGFVVDAPFRNCVQFDFTWGDFLRGWGSVIFDIISSYLLGKLCKKIGGSWLADALGQRLGNLLGQQLLGRLGIELNEVVIEKMIEKAFSTLLQKTILKWGVTGPIGDLIKEIGAPDPHGTVPATTSAPSSSTSSGATGANTSPADAGTSGGTSEMDGGTADPPPTTSTPPPHSTIANQAPLVCE